MALFLCGGGVYGTQTDVSPSWPLRCLCSSRLQHYLWSLRWLSRTENLFIAREKWVTIMWNTGSLTRTQKMVFVPEKNRADKDLSRGWFRSIDLWVMGFFLLVIERLTSRVPFAVLEVHVQHGRWISHVKPCDIMMRFGGILLSVPSFFTSLLLHLNDVRVYGNCWLNLHS